MNDLDSTALQYVLGELDTAAERSFEERLGDSQEAREAVERAVWLSEACAGIEKAEPAPAPVHELRPYRRQLAAAAAILVLVGTGAWLALRGGPSEQPNPSQAPVAIDAAAGEDLLLASWIELGDESWDGADEWSTLADGDAAAEDDASDWMTAAFTDED